MEENQNKTQVKYVLFLLVLVVIVLVGILIYLLIKPKFNSSETLDTGKEIKTERQDNTIIQDQTIDTNSNQQENIPEGEEPTDTNAGTPSGTDEEPADNTEYYKSEIDKDVNSLDSLDLSTPEDDFGDDKVEEL